MPGGYVGGRPKDPDKLSTNPAQIRRRLRRGKNLEQDLELYAQYHHSFKPVAEWDLEELAHGKPRNRKGDFRGKPPMWVTDAIIKEARRRLVDHTNAMIGSQVQFAVQTMIKLIKNEEIDDKGRPVVDAGTKMKACMFIIEHVKGKAKEIVEIDATDMTKKMIAAAIVLDDGQPQDEPIVLEGDFEELEEEDDDEPGE